MAKHLFKPGNKHSKGRPKTPEDIRQLREHLRHQIELTLLTFLNHTKSKIEFVHTAPEATILELVCAKFLEKAVNEGDVARFSLLLDRVLGPISRVDTLKGPEDTGMESFSADVLAAILLRLKAEALHLEKVVISGHAP